MTPTAKKLLFLLRWHTNTSSDILVQEVFCRFFHLQTYAVFKKAEGDMQSAKIFVDDLHFQIELARLDPSARGGGTVKDTFGL